MPDNKKTISKLKDITQEDWREIATIIVTEPTKKYKKAFSYLQDKYNVNFTYQNFYSYVKTNELKILKDAILDKYYKELDEKIDSIKEFLKKTEDDDVLLKKCCNECKKNYEDFIKFLDSLLKKGKLSKEKEEQIKKYMEKLQEIMEQKENKTQKTLAYLISGMQELDNIKHLYFKLKQTLSNLKQK